jgi:hypothetical protein
MYATISSHNTGVYFKDPNFSVIELENVPLAGAASHSVPSSSSRFDFRPTLRMEVLLEGASSHSIPSSAAFASRGFFAASSNSCCFLSKAA